MAAGMNGLAASLREPQPARGLRLAIVGSFGGTHVGGSLARAASQPGVNTIKFDVADAWRGGRLLRAALWHFANRRPLRLRQFSEKVRTTCARSRPEVLIATGAAPLTAPALRKLREMGIRCVNYSTDDPWNPTMCSRWHFRALPEYDAVFTTRRANLEDFTVLGCRDVRYLPFGYDETLCRPAKRPVEDTRHDVLFVGGADRDRVAFMTEFMQSGPPVALVGGYWERFAATRRFALGLKPPDVVSALTAAAKVSLCLVRRANRDGHVMRSFEVAAIGGCMLVEDTQEHREIFGPDRESVRYFRTPAEAAERARSLLADPAERARLSETVRARISTGAHTYRDRLAAMIEVAARVSQARVESSRSAAR
jgi:spore maturation protein CgeB